LGKEPKNEEEEGRGRKIPPGFEKLFKKPKSGSKPTSKKNKKE